MVIQEVRRLLGDLTGTVRVVEVCCGYGTLARHLANGLGREARRVEYFGLDVDWGCVKRAMKNDAYQADFRSYHCQVRDAWDCPGEWAGTAHLVVLNNALHELPPHRYPELFGGFNRLLVSGVGWVCVVDMESLPAGDPEAVAINWTRAEAERLLAAGGFKAGVSAHPKSRANVFLAQVEHATAEVDVRQMLTETREVLHQKLAAAVRQRQGIDDGFHEDTEQLMRWVVLTGTIARIAEEVLAVEVRLAKPGPTPAPSAT
ncbi:MAG: Methyltransferase domain [Gemmataceae bacterium]|nr:Methyltransferase domain [Gemmataceae bacterium]